MYDEGFAGCSEEEVGAQPRDPKGYLYRDSDDVEFCKYLEFMRSTARISSLLSRRRGQVGGLSSCRKSLKCSVSVIEGGSLEE